MSQAFQSLKKQLHTLRTRQNAHLTSMVVASSKTLEGLNQKKGIAENIITLHELNMKYLERDDMIMHVLRANWEKEQVMPGEEEVSEVTYYTVLFADLTV